MMRRGDNDHKATAPRLHLWALHPKDVRMHAREGRGAVSCVSGGGRMGGGEGCTGTGKGVEAEGLLPWYRGLQVQAAPYGVGLHRYRQGRRRRRCGVATRRHERMQAHARKYADALTQYPAWGRRKARGIDNHRGGCLPPRTRFSLHAHTWNMVK